MPPSNHADANIHLGRLLDNLPVGVVVHGTDGRIMSANRFARDLLGRSEEELVGSMPDASTWSLFAPDRTLMASGDYPVNVVLRTRDKVNDVVVGAPGASASMRWLICNAYPEFGERGEVAQVVVCFTDCTALKSAKQKLAKSEEQLRLVLEGSTDAPWDWNLATGEVFFSDRWWRMLGYEPGALPGGAALWMRLAHPHDKPLLVAMMEQLAEDRRPAYSIEIRLRHRLGHYVSVLSRGVVLRDASGKPIRIAGTNLDLSERKAAERRLYELVHFDALTGLPNRRHLTDEMEKMLMRSERTGQFGAVLYIDLDNFKLFNEALGRGAGDTVLRQVAHRLHHAVRHSDQLARVGSDEFVVALEDLGDSATQAVAEATLKARTFIGVLGQAIHLSGRRFLNSSSIGVTVFQGGSNGVETLLKQAQLAMRRAKLEGRSLARFYDPGMQAAAERQASLESALNDDATLHQFVLFCQPQFSGKGRLIGAEALVRWRRADGQLIGPTEFIDMAESSGLIVRLGCHVLQESCRALARWRCDPVLARLKLGVNVSVHQLRDPGFADKVAAILHETDAPPAKLCLELTESVFAADIAELADVMQRVRLQGVNFSLDDFGTGYSSLAYLKRFPLAGLKIDRAFVHDVHLDPNAAPIIQAIIALARALKLDIVAEGVEDEAQRRFLVERGCRTLQGFLLGRPIPIEEFERMHRAAAPVVH